MSISVETLAAAKSYTDSVAMGNAIVTPPPPGLTTQQVQALIDNSLSSLPEGITENEVRGIVEEALKDLSEGLTEQQVKDLIDDAISEITINGGFIPNTAQLATINSGVTEQWKNDTDEELTRLELEKANKTELPDISRFVAKKIITLDEWNDMVKDPTLAEENILYMISDTFNDTTLLAVGVD